MKTKDKISTINIITTIHMDYGCQDPHCIIKWNEEADKAARNKMNYSNSDILSFSSLVGIRRKLTNTARICGTQNGTHPLQKVINKNQILCWT